MSLKNYFKQVSLEDYLKASFMLRMPELIVKKCSTEKNRVVMYVWHLAMKCIPASCRFTEKFPALYTW